MSSVWVVGVEDGEDCVGFSSEPESVGDVDDSVGVVRDEVAAARTKGPSTASSYSLSATSAIGVARVKSSRMHAWMFSGVTGTGPAEVVDERPRRDAMLDVRLDERTDDDGVGLPDEAAHGRLNLDARRQAEPLAQLDRIAVGVRSVRTRARDARDCDVLHYRLAVARVFTTVDLNG